MNDTPAGEAKSHSRVDWDFLRAGFLARVGAASKAYRMDPQHYAEKDISRCKKAFPQQQEGSAGLVALKEGLALRHNWRDRANRHTSPLNVLVKAALDFEEYHSCVQYSAEAMN